MILFSELLIFHQSFHSPEVKGNLIIINIDGRYELRPNLPKNLRLLTSKKVRKFQKKFQNCTGL